MPDRDCRYCQPRLVLKVRLSSIGADDTHAGDATVSDDVATAGDRVATVAAKDAVVWDELGSIADSVDVVHPDLGSVELGEAFIRRVFRDAGAIDSVSTTPTRSHVTFDVTSDTGAPGRAVAMFHSAVVNDQRLEVRMCVLFARLAAVSLLLGRQIAAVGGGWVLWSTLL